LTIVGRIITLLALQQLNQQSGHKPGILGDFSEHGKLPEILCNLREKL